MKITAKIFSALLCLILAFSLVSCGEAGVPATDETTDAATADPHAGHDHGTQADNTPAKPAKTVLTVRFVDSLGNYVHGKSVAKVESGDDIWLAIANAKGEASFTDAQFEKVGEGFSLVVTSLPEGYTCDWVGANKMPLNPGVTEISIVLEKTVQPDTDIAE